MKQCSDENDRLQLQLFLSRSQACVSREWDEPQAVTSSAGSFLCSTSGKQRTHRALAAWRTDAMKGSAIAFRARNRASRSLVLVSHVIAMCTTAADSESDVLVALQKATASKRHKTAECIQARWKLKLLYIAFLVNFHSLIRTQFIISLHFVNCRLTARVERAKKQSFRAFQLTRGSCFLSDLRLAVDFIKMDNRPTLSLSSFFCSSVHQSQWFWFFFSLRCTRMQLLKSIKPVGNSPRWLLNSSSNLLGHWLLRGWRLYHTTTDDVIQDSLNLINRCCGEASISPIRRCADSKMSKKYELESGAKALL